MLRIPFDQLHTVLAGALRNLGFESARAQLCARLFAESSRDGVYSHGLNRFPRFVEQIRKGIVDVHARAELVASSGALERWSGRRGPGNLNAHACMERAIALCRQHGVGCVALADTNHWMRGGSYGWQAADAGVIGICWTNTSPNLPPWGGTTPRLGNNPMVIAVPRKSGPVVLDMAMSQFSYGALESHRVRGVQLPVDGGFDLQGNLTRDPGAIEASGRPLPIGYWKGSGLSMVLDLMAALLSGGFATHQVSTNPIQETHLSQVFVALDLPSLDKEGVAEDVSRRVVESLRKGDEVVRYPGEHTLQIRRENLELGVPVEPRIWEQVEGLQRSA
jgi:3-dehydro-L-gulonate 2-dehydrogenase